MINMRGRHYKQLPFTCVWLLFLIQLCVWWSTVVSATTELPCHFLDSINITNGIFQPNKSIIFGGTVFPEGQYAEIDYILNDGIERETVELHYRGCLCKRKPCIRYCCSFESYVANIKEDREVCHESVKSHEELILDQNKETKRIRLDQHFEIIGESPCRHLLFEDEGYQITHVRFI